ncbi:MAG TPA: hypothetical protein VNI52_04505 [Sphingobacteriaceae bacterium]|nr:hypothetical protein [Sphingobacteriaceae bacterium]
MEEPFDITIGKIIYSVFPEEEGVYTIFKEGIEHIKILKDTDQLWLKLDNETDLPLFGENDEVNNIGAEIQKHNITGQAN